MFLALILAACQPEAAPPPDPGTIADHGTKVFTVNGMEVGERELDLVYKLMQVPQEKWPEFRTSGEGRHVHEEYATATVLYQRAIEQKLHEDPQVALELAFTTRQILGARMRQRLAEDAATDEAIQKFYDDNKAQFTRPEAFTNMILVGDQVLAKDLIGRLQAGEVFATLASAHSIDPSSKDRGGQLGWIRLDDSTIGPAIAAAEMNTITGPVESRFGFHILQVTDRRDATPLEDVRDAIKVQLVKDLGKEKLDEIRKDLTIEWVTPPTEEAKPPGGAMPAGHPPPGGGGAGGQHGGGAGAGGQHGGGGGGAGGQHGGN